MAGSLGFNQAVSAGEKQAQTTEPPIVPPTPPSGEMIGDPSNKVMLNNILGVTLASLGVGAAGRSLLGLRDLANRAAAKKKRTVHPAIVEVNVPKVTEASEKTAQTPGAPPSTGWDWLLGRTTDNLHAKPLYYTGMGAGAIGGLYGGYKIVDKLMNHLQKRDKEKELEQAKEEYRNAVLGQYTGGIKESKEQEELSKDLDILCKLYKEGNFGGAVTNMYLPIAAALALGTGTMTYSWMKGRRPEERLAKAIKQREMLRQATKPPEIYAIAKPVPMSPAKEQQGLRYSPGTEEDEETLSKVASWYRPY